MKILVCGGREYLDKDRLEIVLNQLDGVKELVEGGAGGYRLKSTPSKIFRDAIGYDMHKDESDKEYFGADTLAKVWADKKGGSIIVHTHPADWKKLGPKAGPIRNQEMLEKHPDLKLVVAFPGGNGTADMIKRAKAAGVAVWEIK